VSVEWKTTPIEEVKVNDTLRGLGVVREVNDFGTTIVITTDGGDYPAKKGFDFTAEVLIRA
jgi:hypothetical protein